MNNNRSHSQPSVGEQRGEAGKEVPGKQCTGPHCIQGPSGKIWNQGDAAQLLPPAWQSSSWGHPGHSLHANATFWERCTLFLVPCYVTATRICAAENPLLLSLQNEGIIITMCHSERGAPRPQMQSINKEGDTLVTLSWSVVWARAKIPHETS